MKTNMNRPIPLHNDEEEFFIHKEGVAVIELKHIGKVYHAKGGDLEALKDINLSIEEGEIYGIIGLSGAGKSTLVRCINMLEQPTSGEVIVDGRDMTKTVQNGTAQGPSGNRHDLSQHFNRFKQPDGL